MTAIFITYLLVVGLLMFMDGILSSTNWYSGNLARTVSIGIVVVAAPFSFMGWLGACLGNLLFSQPEPPAMSPVHAVESQYVRKFVEMDEDISYEPDDVIQLVEDD